MDLGILSQSSKMTPLLVKLYDSQKLHSLTTDERPMARLELTSAVAELLAMELSPREAELIADVLIGLMRQAELDLRKALAEQLSSMENVPLRLVLQMANDDIDVAGSILSKSVVLSDLDLIYIIKAKTEEYWQAIAKRPAMSDQIINILVDTKEGKTVETLVSNTNITLTEYGVDVAADMGCKNEAIAKPLLQREEVSADIAKRLYAHVGQALKEHITQQYNLEIGGSIANLVDEVIIEFQDAADGSEHLPTPAMLLDANRYKQKGLLSVKLILGTLRRGQIQSFIAQFSRLTGMSPETVLDILQQPSGQGLAVACRAFRIMKPDFISIFLLTNRIRNEEKMVDLKDMTKAINYFTRIDESVAQDIIKNSSENLPKD